MLHDSGTAAFEATLHEWHDLPAILSQVLEGARRAGFGGLGMFLDALTEQGTGVTHSVSVVRVGGPAGIKSTISTRSSAARRPSRVTASGAGWSTRTG